MVLYPFFVTAGVLLRCGERLLTQIKPIEKG
jgi:hypothetical protein